MADEVRAAVLAIFLAAISSAQQDTPAPTFHSATKLVEVDVVARSNGAPAAGLTKDDFTVLDNGKPQKIAFFLVHSSSVPAAPAAGVTPLSAGVVSNRAEAGGNLAGNTTVLLLDQRNTPQPDQAFAIPRIAKFIDTRRQQDRTGIYTFMKDGRIKVVQEITANSELLSRAAGSLKAQDPDYRSPDVSGLAGIGGHAADEFTALLIRTRAADTRQMLEQVASHLANVPGRKSLIWISAGFPLVWNGIDFIPDMQEAARKLNDANVAIYGVDPRGFAGALSGQTAIAPAEFGGVHTQEQIAALMLSQGRFAPLTGLDAMGLLSKLTGGLTFANDNGIENLIQAAADDGEFTYTLGFYPAPEDRGGIRHSLTVLVSKPGIGLRYRLSYLASGAVAANDHPPLQQLLTDAVDSLQVRLSAAASPEEANPGVWQVRVNISVGDLQLTHEDSLHAGGIDVSFHVEGSGQVVTKTLKIAIPDDQFAEFLEKGIDTTQTIEADGTAGDIRVVVQDRNSGAAGSLTVPLSAQSGARPLVSR